MSHLMAHLLCAAQCCMPTMHPAPQPHGGYVQGPQTIPTPGQEQACTFSLLFLQKPCSGRFSCRGQQQQHISALAQGSPPAIRTFVPTGTPLPAILCGVSAHQCRGQAPGAAALSPSNQELSHSSAMLPMVAPFPSRDPDQRPFLEKRLMLLVQVLPVSSALLSATYPCNPGMPTDPNRGPSNHTHRNETPYLLSQAGNSNTPAISLQPP